MYMASILSAMRYGWGMPKPHEVPRLAALNRRIGVRIPVSQPAFEGEALDTLAGRQGFGALLRAVSNHCHLKKRSRAEPSIRRQVDRASAPYFVRCRIIAISRSVRGRSPRYAGR